MAEFGREGSGPGEFLTPSILAVDSLLTIDDPRQGRQVRFLLDGSHVETTRVRHFSEPNGGEIPLRDAVTLRGGFTVGMIPATFVVSYMRDVVNDFRNTIVLLDPGGQSVDTLFSYHWGTVAWKTETVASGRGTPFGVAGAWAVLGDTAVVLADGGRRNDHDRRA